MASIACYISCVQRSPNLGEVDKVGPLTRNKLFTIEIQKKTERKLPPVNKKYFRFFNYFFSNNNFKLTFALGSLNGKIYIYIYIYI